MNKLIHLSAVAAVMLLAGCATHPKDVSTHERGWIGGLYKCAKTHAAVDNWLFGGDNIVYGIPPDLEHTQKTGILTTELGTKTPAYRSGLRSGDLILELDHQRVTSLPAFWSTIRAAHPSSLLPIKAYREGRTMEFDVEVGREKFKNRGTLMVGLPGFWQWLHPIPTRERPLFSLIALGWQGDDASPVEFDSVEEHYRHNSHPKDKQQGDDQDWRCWLAIIQVSKGKTILGQEPVMAGDAPLPH